MISVWILLIGTDIALITLAVLWLNDRRKNSLSHQEDRLLASMRALDTRASQYESRWLEFQNEMTSQLKTLHRVCDQAQRILDRSRQTLAHMVPTLEECELKAVLSGHEIRASNEPTIPSVKDLEKTRHRIQSEVSMDLRSLLREQLI
jgi:hypothetical protein